jgi:hypothetical protein
MDPSRRSGFQKQASRRDFRKKLRKQKAGLVGPAFSRMNQ